MSRGYVPNNFSRRNIFFYFRKCLDHFPPFALVGYIHRLDRTYKLSKTRATFSPHLHSHSYSLCAPSLLLGFLLRGPSWRGNLERESSFSVWFVDVLMSQVVVVVVVDLRKVDRKRRREGAYFLFIFVTGRPLLRPP